MEEEEDDDIYAPEDVLKNGTTGQQSHGLGRTVTDEKMGEDLEEGEEEGEEVEEEESDSDIDIITERKDEPKTEALQPQRVSVVKGAPARTSTPDSAIKTPRSPAVKVEPSAKSAPLRSGASYPAIKSSKIDVDAKPIYEPSGKPITEIDMDADLTEEDKPWRRPGTDQTDYFNYGFDEFTWASYCLKQTTLRKEVADSAKQMKEMQDFLSMPSVPGGPTPGGPGMPPMPGMDIPPEMQQMMAAMMASGQDPSTIDPMMMMQMMQGAQGGANAGQGQNFGGAQGFGQQQGQNQQQMGYGYGGGAGASGGGGGRNQGGRGRGGRNW